MSLSLATTTATTSSRTLTRPGIVCCSGGESADDISVSHVDGSTFIVYGEPRIELEDVELTREQVWARVTSE